MDFRCCLLSDPALDGPANMAADEVLLRSAANGQASLRFYGWTEPTLSLGYFQPAARRLEDPLLRDLPFVRRPTGGEALVHHHELTYCLAVPSQQARPSLPWLAMHEVIVAALAELGITARPRITPPPGPLPEAERGRKTTCAPPLLAGEGAGGRGLSRPFSGFLCFKHITAGDLIVNGAKVV